MIFKINIITNYNLNIRIHITMVCKGNIIILIKIIKIIILIKIINIMIRIINIIIMMFIVISIIKIKMIRMNKCINNIITIIKKRYKIKIID